MVAPDEIASAHLANHEAEVIGELRAFLRLPNVAPDRQAILANAEHLVALRQRHGLTARILETPDAMPAVYAEYAVPGAQRTTNSRA